MNKKLIWLIELILWAIVVSVVTFSTVYVKSYVNQKANSYYLFFKDVDGLEDGSPVRLMGMQIGYVQNLKVFEDKIFVSFLVTKNDVKIPENSTATVEFYGLGGSKSLEIRPFEGQITPKTEDLIITKEPYRIKQVFDVQANISKTIVNMSTSFADVVPESKIKKTRDLIKVNSKIESIDANVSTINKIAEELTNDVKKDNKTKKDKDNASNSNGD